MPNKQRFAFDFSGDTEGTGSRHYEKGGAMAEIALLLVSRYPDFVLYSELENICEKYRNQKQHIPLKNRLADLYRHPKTFRVETSQDGSGILVELLNSNALLVPKIKPPANSNAGAASIKPVSSIPTGAGFGDSETNARVEEAAITCVTLEYEKKGWNVRSVESDNLGYDLNCNLSHHEEFIEVKGVQGDEPSFIITSGECAASRKYRQFVLCVVTSALSGNPKIHRFHGKPIEEFFELAPISYRARLRKN